MFVSTNQTTRCKHPEDQTRNLRHCQNLVLHEEEEEGKKTNEKTSSTRLSVCDAIPATKPSRIFMRFGTTFAAKSCRASVSWKLVETFGTLIVLTESLPCLPYFSTDFTQIGYGIPVVCNATEQLQFRENRFGDSNILLHGVNEILTLFFNRLSANW
jgi:hypothetical protein